jgi:hypothetical protein
MSKVVYLRPPIIVKKLAAQLEIFAIPAGVRSVRHERFRQQHQRVHRDRAGKIYCKQYGDTLVTGNE